MTALQEWTTASSTPLVEIHVTERFDASTALRLRDRLEDALRVRPERLVVDLSACPAFDASGLRVLLEVHCDAMRTGGELVLRGAGPRVHQVIALSGLQGVFTVEA